MIHTVICDDDQEITRYIEKLINQKYKKNMMCSCVYSGRELMDLLSDSEKNPVNLVILDIALGEDDGIAIAKDLGKTYPNVKVILLSGYMQLASNVFDADPVYFLSKPVNSEKLYAAIDKGINLMKNQKIIAVTVPGTGGKMHRIKVEDIIFLETASRNCIIHTDYGEVVEATMKLSDVMKLLPSDFIYTHQSFACNLNKVKSFSKEKGILMADGSDIPVSRRHLKKVKEALSLSI